MTIPAAAGSSVSGSPSAPNSAELATIDSTRTSALTIDTADAPQLYVVFRVGDADYALAARDVLQMESYTGATTVPGARPFVQGIIQLRGRVVPVVDLRLRFGLSKSEPTLESRVVVAERRYDEKEGTAQSRAVALLVDRAREVVRIRPSQLKPPPRLVDDGGFVQFIVQLEDRTIIVLDFARVIGEEAVDV